MRTHRRRFAATLLGTSALATLLVAPRLAWSHGNAAHASTAAPVAKEQMDWGIAGDAQSVQRTIRIRMSDTMRFTPERIEIRQGETVRLVLKNEGRLLHEFVLGTKKQLDEHAALMLKFPDMEHQAPYMAHVPAGQSGQIVWRFNRAGEFDFACLIAGHYQAGMVGKLRVTAK